MIVYFSGTGNSRWCARIIAGALDDTPVDAAGYIKNSIAAELTSRQPWVFVSPTYAWQLPRVFRDFIRTGCFNGSKDAYFVMTCGSEIGNAGAGIESLCQDIGLHYKGVLEVVMPENYIAMFNVPAPAESAKTVQAARPVLDSGIDLIWQGLPFPPPKISAVDRLKSGIVNQGFYAYYVNAKQFRSTEDCVSCGKCVEFCPLNNIHLQDGRPLWGSRCTHCMACISYCPQEAIEYGRHSAGKLRYRCEDYTK